MVTVARRGFAPFNGDIERGKRQSSVYRSVDGIAHHAPRPGIENDGNLDEAPDDDDVGDVCHSKLVGPVGDDQGGEIGEDRLIVIAVRRRYEAAADFGLKIVLAHQPANLLVVDDQALLTKGGSDATPPVVFELIADGGINSTIAVSSVECAGFS